MNHHPTAMFSECCVLPKNLKAKSKKILDILINFINILPALFIKFHHRGTKPVLSLPKGHREIKNYKESVFKTKFFEIEIDYADICSISPLYSNLCAFVSLWFMNYSS